MVNKNRKVESLWEKIWKWISRGKGPNSGDCSVKDYKRAKTMMKRCPGKKIGKQQNQCPGSREEFCQVSGYPEASKKREKRSE